MAEPVHLDLIKPIVIRVIIGDVDFCYSHLQFLSHSHPHTNRKVVRIPSQIQIPPGGSAEAVGFHGEHFTTKPVSMLMWHAEMGRGSAGVSNSMRDVVVLGEGGEFLVYLLYAFGGDEDLLSGEDAAFHGDGGHGEPDGE